eukprot:6840060-Prymnesium_polylepis.1
MLGSTTLARHTVRSSSPSESDSAFLSNQSICRFMFHPADCRARCVPASGAPGRASPRDFCSHCSCWVCLSTGGGSVCGP